MLLLFQAATGVEPEPEPTTQGGYSPPRNKKRYYAEIGGMRFLFPTEEARRRAVQAESPAEEVAQVIKKATVRKAPVAAKAEPVAAIEPEHDDEEDIEMLLMAL